MTDTQVFTMVGFLRGKNDSGCFIERFKQGVSQGAAQEYSLARNNIIPAAVAKLAGLTVGDEVLYKTANYVIQDIEKKQPKGNGGGGWGGKPKSPEERRSIELQSCLRTTADVFIAALQKSNAPVAMDFATMMKAIRAEAEISANWVRDQSKGVQ